MWKRVLIALGAVLTYVGPMTYWAVRQAQLHATYMRARAEYLALLTNNYGGGRP